MLIFLSDTAVSGESRITTPASISAEICRTLGDETVSFQIASWIETAEAGEGLLRFYQDSQCRPVWSNEQGIAPQTLYLIHAIKRSAEDGLDIYDPAYNLVSIMALMSSLKSASPLKNRSALLAQLDILLTDAYMMLGKHLYHGVLPHDMASEKWSIAAKKSIDFGLLLRESIQNNAIQESLDHLAPSSMEYQSLKTILVKYLRIEEDGGWKTLDTPFPDDIREDAYFQEEIKDHLRIEGDLSYDDNSVEGYRDALRTFQKRHGIKADAVVGPNTLLKLNMSLEEKILAIRLNMERWRWMPENMESSYISVNLPDFSLSVIHNDQTIMSMKAIVGREERPTPIFNAHMKYIVINPYWRIPDTILREDIFPKVRKNIRYLKKEKIRIFRHGDEKGKREIHPARIDWENADPATFPYFLRQDAGAKNVLGRIKFIFPNPYDIYIHDTPDQYLFDQTARGFSSGCIRIQEPIALADFLLENDGNEHRVASLISGSTNKNIFFSKPVKVYINYWTVWKDEEGLSHFRDDLYGYDRELAEILGWYRL